MSSLQNYRMTIILSVLNISVFFIFLKLVHYDNQIPFYFSAWKFETGLFAPYQLVSYQFIHANFSHLYFNLLFFIPISIYLEPITKSNRLFYYFIFAGIIAGLFHLFFYKEELPLVGASGSIWGISVIYALTQKYRIIKLIVLAGFLKEIWISSTYIEDGVAHWCHIGGAIGGILIYLLDKKFLDESNVESNRIRS